MTLQEIIKILQDIALTQPNVRSVGEGDIYDTLNAEGSTRYAYFFITQNKHTQTEDTDRYSLNVFYIDRLEDDKSNKLQIQSIGKEVLSNIFNTFADDFDADFSGVDFQVFTERFSDYCAGVYATVTFEVMRDGSCPDYYGDKYVPFIPIKIINQTKAVKFTSNGIYDITYDSDFTGLESVVVDVDVDSSQYYDQGYNEGYSQGYTNGETEGYGQGYANGYTGGYTEGETQGISSGIEQGRQQVINESEDLYVSENGVYEGANLYKKVEVNVDVEAQYNKGYEDGEKAATENTVVLDVTENGTIYTKYADIPEWNEPLTGDDFYSYALLEGNTYFNTGYVGNEYSVVEFWFKYDDTITQGSSMGTIVGKQGSGGTDIMKLRANNYATEVFIVERKGTQGSSNIKITKDVWHKIKLSYEGLWVDGERMVTYITVPEFTDNVPFCINGTTGWEYGGSGYYGMVKIDDNVYIPTATGFINRGTGEPLDVKGTNYKFFRMEPPVPIENLIKQVDVNVKVKVAKDGIKLGYWTVTEIPEYLDFSDASDLSYMFYSCYYLTSLNNPTLQYLKPINLEHCFEYARKIGGDISVLATWDVSNVTNMGNFFYQTYLTDCSVISNWNVSNVTNMSYCFNGTYITDYSFIANWNTSKVADMSNMIGYSNAVKCPAIDCSGLSGKNKYPFTYYSDCKTFTDFGGFINAKMSSDNNYCLVKFPNLTYESWLNVIDGLYDFTGNGETPNSSQGTMKLHPNAYNLLTEDDIARATNKGWSLT